jgi:hypothetical protein
MTLASSVPMEYFLKDRAASDIVEVEKLPM